MLYLGLDCLTNSPHHYYRKCIENNMENINIDIRVNNINVNFAAVSLSMK